MKINLINIAKLYTKTIFFLSKENNNMNYWQYMLLFCTRLKKNIYINNSLFKNILLNFLIIKFIKFIKLYKKKINIYFKNLVYIMIKNKHLLLFPYILKQFIMLKNIIYKNIFKIKIITAYKFKKNQKKKIKKIFKNKLNLNFKFNYFIKKNIINGIILRSNNIILDTSINNYIKQFKKILQN